MLVAQTTRPLSGCSLFLASFLSFSLWPTPIDRVSPNRCLNPLSAKASFQLWHPGGQRLKVISFSWSEVKSPSKCFSNREPTKIIASCDKKTVQCPCPVSQIGALKFVTPQWSTPEMSRMTAFLRFPRAAAWPSYSCTFTCTITAKCKTVVTLGLENRLLKTPWYVDDEGLRLRTIRRWLRCVFFSIWTMVQRTRLVPIATTIDGPSALDLTNAGGRSSFHSSFWRTITKVLCSAWVSP